MSLSASLSGTYLKFEFYYFLIWRINFNAEKSGKKKKKCSELFQEIQTLKTLKTKIHWRIIHMNFS